MVHEDNKVYKEFMGLLYVFFVNLTDHGFYLEGTLDGERGCWLVCLEVHCGLLGQLGELIYSLGSPLGVG